MQIKNSFDVPLPADEAWRILMDFPRIAPCVPGAELTGQTADGGYEGKVSVRLGPVALSFGGTAKIVHQDDAACHAQLTAGGQDVKGRGTASADISFNVSPTETGSRADIVTDVTLTGLVAQYGRGTGLIQSVATQIANQFAENLRAMIEADKAGPAAAGVSGTQTAAAPRPAPAPATKPISGFALLRAAIRGLFSRSS